MRRVKLGAASLNQTPLDWTNNLNNIYYAIQRAKDEDTRILCLPELCITGYGCEDQFHSPAVIERAYTSLKALASVTSNMFVCVGLPVLHKGALYNTVAVLADGEIAGLVPKRHLANDGVHYEHRWFKAWPDQDISEHHNDLDTEIGDLRFDFCGIKVGFEICEDAWAAKRVGARLAADGVEIILNPSASHFAFGKHQNRINIVREGSRSFNVAYVYSNLLGNESGRTIYDGDTIIANNGTIIANGDRFSYNSGQLTTAIVDLDVSTQSRMKLGSYNPNLQGEYNYEDIFSAESPLTDETPTLPAEIKYLTKFEEFTQAMCLGMFDYMRKTKSNGFVVSLSGGADSTAAACLVRLIPFYGRKNYKDAFERKLKYTSARSFLTCIYQPTRHSTKTTRNAAKAVAEELSADYMELDVDALVEMYTARVERALGRELKWETDDIAMQNIQARARAPGAWMIANINNAILLATSNRSEAAVGYATMDGDTCGGLSPLAGIDKDFLLKWLVWARKEFSWDSLDLVINQKPTAELRPEQYKQEDESDLMPYDILDAIEGLAIRDKKPPLEVFKYLEGRTNDRQLGKWVEKFFKLWCRNQWKRERYAPSFHLDDKNLDPKSWCRFPILSGGFDTELKAMWKYINERRNSN